MTRWRKSATSKSAIAAIAFASPAPDPLFASIQVDGARVSWRPGVNRALFLVWTATSWVSCASDERICHDITRRSISREQADYTDFICL